MNMYLQCLYMQASKKSERMVISGCVMEKDDNMQKIKYK